MLVSLYIGHHKVGSTALQAFLAQNANALIDAGLLYPFTEMTGAAHALVRARKGDHPGHLSANIREPHSALAYRLLAEAAGREIPRQFTNLPRGGMMFHAIRAQIEALAPKGVILCSEAFANFSHIAPNLVKRLCDQFEGADFHLYCALRRPDDYMVSWHGQRIKVGEPGVAPLAAGAWRHYVETIHFDYRLVLDAWLRQVPGKSRALRNYADVLAAGGSEADFIAHSGLEFPAGLKTMRDVNKSLPLAALELQRRANLALPQADAAQMAGFLSRVGARVSLPKNAEVEMYAPGDRAEIHALFKPVHDWLCHAAHCDAFFPDLDSMLEPRPIPEARAMARLLDQLTPEKTADLPEALRAFIAAERDALTGTAAT